MKKILTFLQVHHCLCIFSFFCCLFFFGLCSFQDYGLAGDAYEERRTCLVNYKYLVPSVSQIQTDTVDFSQIADLETYFDRYYGVALQMPTILIEHLFHFSLTYNQIFQMRHLYTFLIYFIGCIFFYLLVRTLTGRRVFASLGTAMFVLSPHILANSLYNIKDIPFLSIFIVNLYFAVRFLRQPCLRNTIWLGIISAFCTNTRIIGAIVIFLCLIFYLLGKKEAGKFLQRLAFCLLCGLACFIVYVAITPVTWQNPFSALLETLQTFSRFDAYHFQNYFMGHTLDGTTLPWYYLPVWIGMTTPVLYLILFFIGIFYIVIAIIHKTGRKPYCLEKQFLFLTAAIPMAYVFIQSPVLYNGWRHFYFVYSVLIIFATFGLQELTQRFTRYQNFFFSALGLYLVAICLWIGKNHPAEYVYFNSLFRDYANANMDKDYWNVGAASSVQYVLDSMEQSAASVIFYPHSWYSAGIFPASQQEKIQSVSRYFPQNADYYLYTYQKNPANEKFYGFYYYEELYSPKTGGVKYNAVFQRIYDLTRLSNLKLFPEEQILSYGHEDISWEIQSLSQNTVSFIGRVTEPVLSDRIYLSCLNSSSSFSSFSIVDTSGNCHNATFSELVDSDINTGVWVFFDPCFVSELHFDFSFLDPSDNYLFLAQLLTPASQQETYHYAKGLNQLSTGENWPEANNAGDSSLTTSWHTDDQREGIQAILELHSPTSITGFSLETGGKDWDCPQNLLISVSMNGEKWTDIEYQSTNQIDFYFSPVQCQYIRLALGTHDSENTSNWTIAEVFTYTDSVSINH